MNAKLLLSFCAVALVAAGWFFLEQSPATAPQGPAPGNPATADTAKAGDPSAATGKVAAETAHDAKTERVEAHPDVTPPADDRFVVRGRLVGGDGSPRAGVELQAETWPIDDAFAFEDLPVQPSSARNGKPVTATTGTDGTFRFEFARDRAGSLSLSAADLVFAEAAPRFRGGQARQDLGDLTVLRASTLGGVVHDQNGQPVADVKVAAAVGLLGGTSETKTAADGTFTIGKLRPGKWTLRTLSGRFVPTVEEFTLAAEQQRNDLVLVVKPGNAIAGQVVDDRGVGVAGMKVASKRKESHGGVDVERFTADEATVTDANGYFTLAGLVEETATIRTFGPGHASVTLADVAVGTGNLLLRVDRLAVIEGVLVDGAGSPIEKSRVSASLAMKGGPGMVVAEDLDFDPIGDGLGRAVTAADGSFRVENVRPGDLVLTARGDGHRPVKQEGLRVQAGQTVKGVRLVADLGATAKVTVRADDGSPVADAEVVVRRPRRGGEADGGGMFVARRVEVDSTDGNMVIGGPNQPVGTAKTNASGVATVRGLPAGDFEVVASHKDWAPSPAVAVALPRVGEVEAKVQLRQPGKVQVAVLDPEGNPVAGAEVVVSAKDKATGVPPARVRTDERGTGLVGGLVAGEYTAALTRPAKAAQVADMMISFGDDSPTLASSARPVTVFAGRTMLVQLQQPILTTIRGVVSGADGPLAAAAVSLESESSPGLDLPGIPGLGGGQHATTAADGSYSIEAVEAGNYVLRFGTKDQVVKAKQAIVVPANARELRQDLQLRVGSVRLVVVAKDTGEPVAGAEVKIDPGAEGDGAPREQRVMMVSMVTTDGSGGPGETTMTLGSRRVRTDDDGLAVIPEVPVGTYVIEISHRRYAKNTLRQVVVVERQPTDCGRVEMSGAGTIRGKVTGSDGKTVGMAMVQHRKVGTTSEDSDMAMGGSYRVGGLEAGKYEVRAQGVGPGEAKFSPWREVEVKAGDTAVVDLQLPPQ